MPSVHYKFKSSLDYKTLVFEGIQISVGELKKLIYENEKIGKTADFDLQITNAQTKQVYEDDSIAVQRNASVIVARVPVAVQHKLPKVWDTRNEGKVNQTPRNYQSSRPVSSMLPGGNDLSTKSNLTEEEKIKLMQSEATQDYDPSQYQRGRHSVTSGPAPATLKCNRCGQNGHWLRECPMINVRRPTGIPKDELMETTPDDPQAMLTPSGRYVVPIMDKQAHLMGKKERPPFFDEETPVVEPEPKKEIPSELMCPLCSDLLREAVVIPCCGYSFCDECIRNSLLESDQHECPHCREKGISPDSLVPNSQLRKAVTNFRNETGYIYARRQRMDAASAKTASNVATQPASNSSAGKLKINLASAGAARATAAAEQRSRPMTNAVEARSSPAQQATQSPDTRGRDSPNVTSKSVASEQPSAASITSMPSFSDSANYNRNYSTYTKSMTPASSSNVPVVKIMPQAPTWPPVSIPTSIIGVPLMQHPHMVTSGPMMATIFPPGYHPAAPHTAPMVAHQPMMGYPQHQQPALPAPPGVQPVASISSYPPPMNTFMTSQPPPPGVPASIPAATPVITPAYTATRPPATFFQPRRPLTEAEFYDAKRRMFESRLPERHKSPKPKDAWEEFLARKDQKRRRSSSSSSRSTSRSRSRSSIRSRRSRSRSITRSRSRSRSPSYHSRRRRRDHSREYRPRRRTRSRSRTRSPYRHHYHRRPSRSSRSKATKERRSSPIRKKQSNAKESTSEKTSHKKEAMPKEEPTVDKATPDKRSTPKVEPAVVKNVSAEKTVMEEPAVVTETTPKTEPASTPVVEEKKASENESVPKEVPTDDKEGSVEKRRKVKKEKKKKRKHHHKTPKKKHQDEEKKEAAENEKSTSLDEKPKDEAMVKSRSQKEERPPKSQKDEKPKSEKSKSDKEEKSNATSDKEKKERRHRSHKKEKRKSEDSSKEHDSSAKKKRRI